jgi:hypothetical protein
MGNLTVHEKATVRVARKSLIRALKINGLSIESGNNFVTYKNVRVVNGDRRLNQAFDPEFTHFDEDDFWIFARNKSGDVIATYCIRYFAVRDFYQLIRSQELWFSKWPGPSAYLDVQCIIPAFGGEIAHGGGLWVRQDYRGSSRLAFVLPRLGRALALDRRPLDHDTAMIRNDPVDAPQAATRKATFAGIRLYGFARVSRFANGWFPPEGRHTCMYLCHATKAEAIASLSTPIPEFGPRRQHSNSSHTGPPREATRIFLSRPRSNSKWIACPSLCTENSSSGP